jgi:hypothetical protein
MKRLGLILVLLLAASPAWSTKKVTVAQLKDTLSSMQQAKKSDAEVAAALKQLELTEQLTLPTKNSFVPLVPGQLSTEQIFVLEARSATLPPPAADLPATAAPDPAAQKALLDKTAEYVSKTYSQLPAITATKTTLRFQDNVEAAAPSSGMQGGAKDITTGSGFVSAFQFVKYINSTEKPVSSLHGAELPSTAKDTTPWGSNKMNAVMDPDPGLGTVFAEAQDAGTIKWLRWETVNGKPAAVFNFDVPKKKAHFPVTVCCFPEVTQAGKAQFTSAATGGALGSGGGGASGNFQTATGWKPYRNSVPYHGEFFVDAETGIIVRMITFADLKSTDVVHQDDMRIDYGPVSVGDKMLVLPTKTVSATEVVPNGDSGSAGRYSVRKTYLTTEYKNYQLAGAN